MVNKTIKQGVVLLILLSLFIMTSCTEGEIMETPEGEETENITPVNGGNMYFSVFDPSHLNPLLQTGEDNYHLLKLIFEPLITLDAKYKVKGSLAEKWEFQEGGKKLILHLNKKATWHDEKPFTAQDVKFTIDALRHKDVISSYKGYIKDLSSYKIVDEKTIELNYENGNSGNLETLIFPILPAHRFKKPQDVMAANKWSPIGTGPFKFVKYQEGRDITLKSNEKYWGKVPFIESITVKIQSKREGLVKAFESKNSDLLRTTEVDFNRFNEDPLLDIYPYTTQKYNFIGLNNNNELFKSPQMRKAIQMAINPKEMLETIYLKHGEYVNIPISPDSWLYQSENIENPYNPEESKNILEELGWKDENNNKILEKKNVKGKKEEFTFELITNKENQLRQDEAKMIQDYLYKVGIKVNIKHLPFEEVKKSVEKKKFDAILTGWDLSFVPDLTFAFHSKEIEKGANFVSFKNNEIDSLLVETLKSKNQEEKKELYSKLQNKLEEQNPYINLYFIKAALVVNNRIKGPIEPTDYNIFNNVENWFIEYK